MISLDPSAASATLRVISLVVALCSSTAVAMVDEISLTCDHGSDGGDGVDRSMSIGLNGGDLVADVFGRLRRLAGEFLNFVGDHGEPFAGFSGACRFDGGIQGQQLCLLCD